MRFTPSAPHSLAILAIMLLAGACRGADSRAGPGEDSWTLVGAGYSFGMCGGPCRGELTIDGSRLVLIVRGDFDLDPLATNAGELSPEGQKLLIETLGTVDDIDLPPVSGCPDCADGGAAYLALQRGGESSEYSYEFGNPPPAISPIDSLATTLISALQSCKRSNVVSLTASCVPMP